MTFVEPFSQQMKFSYPQMGLCSYSYYYIILLMLLLSLSVVFISLVLIFTSEQSKGIVLYSLRNCGQESGMCTGISLPCS